MSSLSSLPLIKQREVIIYSHFGNLIIIPLIIKFLDAEIYIFATQSVVYALNPGGLLGCSISDTTPNLLNQNQPFIDHRWFRGAWKFRSHCCDSFPQHWSQVAEWLRTTWNGERETLLESRVLLPTSIFIFVATVKWWWSLLNLWPQI